MNNGVWDLFGLICVINLSSIGYGDSPIKVLYMKTCGNGNHEMVNGKDTVRIHFSFVIITQKNNTSMSEHETKTVLFKMSLL